ncbi:MAG: hypothetical protein ACT4PT_03950, partial [Methanobacteriota archaeon]
MNPALLLQAFVAGVVGLFAPCTIAMLPAYLGYFVGRGDAGDKQGGKGQGARGGHRTIGGLGVFVGLVLIVVGLYEIRRFN